MRKSKNVQISQELFMDLIMFFLMDDYERFNKIKDEIEKKFDKLVLHELYTKSKTGVSEGEREKARQEYLDKIGVLEEFRW